jgi:hypothetical protein
MKQKSMKTATIIGLLALGVGYLLGTEAKILRAGSSTGVSPLEYFSSPATFSEVETAKATLDGEAWQFISDMRSKYLTPSAAGYQMGEKPEFGEWAAELEAKIQELHGTRPEFVITEELLHVLAAGNLPDRWLDLYLQVLYESPTQSLIPKRLGLATAFAAATGRADEVEAGLSHLMSIPTEFETKQKIKLAAARAPLTSQSWNVSFSVSPADPQRSLQ